MKYEGKSCFALCTPAQKIGGSLALFALFLCGFMLGVGFEKTDKKTHVLMNADVLNLSSYDCVELKNKILKTTDITLLREYKKIYSVNCIKKEEPKPVVEDVQEKSACAVVEEELKAQLLTDISYIYDEPNRNIEIYKRLFQYGCEENKADYQAAIEREKEVVRGLTDKGFGGTEPVCVQIEKSLLARLPNAGDYTDSETRIERAKIYANLSERGCSENSEKYVELTKQELAIARALEDDNFDSDEVNEVSETYKRINMQQAAQDIFDTAKKLTNPAIDFILEVEKVINE